MDSPSVRHDSENHRFELVVEGKTAVAEYTQEGKVMTFTHTWVPPELRGQGVAAKLMDAALSFARREKNKIVPQCSYVETYLQRHPGYEDLRA